MQPAASTAIDGFVRLDSPHFMTWLNTSFQRYLQPTPDSSAEPCFGTDGRVRKRGAWDDGPLFSSERLDFKFMRHQLIIRDFLTETSPYRGLLLYHGLGSGKTCTAIGVSEGFKTFRQIIVMSPASLRDSFIAELRKCGEYRNLSGSTEHVTSEILKRYVFVSYDASNTMQQIQTVPNQLNDKLLIVDEVHNLISMIIHGGPKGQSLYHAMMEAKNLRLLFLSGTPLINDPFELGIMASLLRGYIDDKNKTPLFPSNDQFYFHFVDTRNPVHLALKNTIMLKRRLVGLLSYYGGLQPQDKVMPKQRTMTVEVEMSDRQFELYERARTLERETEKKMRTMLRRGSNSSTARNFGRQVVDLRVLFSASKDQVSIANFRSLSRQFCNFAFPASVPRYVSKIGNINAAKLNADGTLLPAELLQDDGVNATDDGGSLSARDKALHAESLRLLDEQGDLYLRKNLAVNSPKYAALMQDLEKSRGTGYVYSQFRTMEGIGVLALVLKAHGYIEFGWGHSDKPPMAPLAHTRDSGGRTWGSLTPAERRTFEPLTYMVWPTSNVKSDKREILLNTFNSEENKTGRLIKVFLATKAGAEGINLMNVRSVFILEPYWNEMLVKQAIGRAVRFCSHATLPAAERTVDVFRYVSTVKTHACADVGLDGLPESTDQHVAMIALKKQSIIDQLEHVMKEVSIDCSLNLAHSRLATSRPIACFQGTGDNSTNSMELSQDMTDTQLFNNKDLHRLQLRRVELSGRPYRIDAAEYDTLQRFSKRKFKKGESAHVNVYHPLNNFVVGKLLLVQGRPVKFAQVQ